MTHRFDLVTCFHLEQIVYRLLVQQLEAKLDYFQAFLSSANLTDVNTDFIEAQVRQAEEIIHKLAGMRMQPDTEQRLVCQAVMVRNAKALAAFIKSSSSSLSGRWSR